MIDTDEAERRLRAALEAVARSAPGTLRGAGPAKRSRRVALPRRSVVLGLAVTACLILVVSIVTVHAHGSAKRVVTGSDVTVAGSNPGSGIAEGKAFIGLPFDSDGHTVDVWSWQGELLSTVHTGPVAECCTTIQASPDGTRLEVSDGAGAQILNDQGTILASSRLSGVWADDNVHLCAEEPAPGTDVATGGLADLVLIDPGVSQRVVAQVGGYGPHSAPGVAWCSVRDNEAIVFEDTMGSVTTVTAVRLSDGADLSEPWTGVSQNRFWAAISGNGSYALIEGNPTSQIIDTATGTVVGTVPGQGEAISWAGHDVVTLLLSTDQIEVVDWVTNKVIWVSGPPVTKCPCSSPEVTAASQPGTDNLVVNTSDEPGQASGQGTLWLIPNDLPARLLDPKVAAGVA
jgi:hypothetical protein